ncbi:MAG: hypothetical protein IPL08_04780 [Saprospiraceae bacterium]|nr:hypothetical protein [Saprospiraceae bacterium]
MTGVSVPAIIAGTALMTAFILLIFQEVVFLHQNLLTKLHQYQAPTFGEPL